MGTTPPNAAPSPPVVEGIATTALAVDPGKAPPDRVVFDLHQTVEQTLPPLHALARNKGLQLHCTVAPDVPFQVWGDPHLLRLVLINLLDNAIKFTAKGQVNCIVCVDASNSYSVAVCFQVQDTGVGIAPEQLYKTASNGAATPPPARHRITTTPLGLGDTAWLIARMGGHLDIQSTPGQGSTLSFTLVLDTVAGDANATPLFDYAQACASVDTEIVDIIAPAFLDRYAKDISTLRHSIDTWNVQSTLCCAHSLKGILGHFGVTPAMHMAGEMASMAATGDLAHTDMLFLSLSSEIELLAEYLRNRAQAFSTQCA